jgi:hypothetical protein
LEDYEKFVGFTKNFVEMEKLTVADEQAMRVVWKVGREM